MVNETLKKKIEAQISLKVKCDEMQAELDIKNAEISELENSVYTLQENMEETCEELFDFEEKVRKDEKEAIKIIRNNVRKYFIKEIMSN